MSGRQQWVYHVEPSRFPDDFSERLERFVDAAGLSWRGLARHLRLSARCVRRWRTGTKPDSGHLLALLNLAIEMRLLHHLVPAAAEQDEGTDPRILERRNLHAPHLAARRLSR